MPPGKAPRRWWLRLIRWFAAFIGFYLGWSLTVWFLIFNKIKLSKISQKKWAANNPGYWKTYRERHPEKAERNRMLQTIRNRRRSNAASSRQALISKRDATKVNIYTMSEPSRWLQRGARGQGVNERANGGPKILKLRRRPWSEKRFWTPNASGA
jgi:hypothetical protein